MRHPYGVDPAHPSADLLVALYRERYGDLHDLERERFSIVVPRRPTPAPVLEPISEEQGDLNLFNLAHDLEARDRLMRGDAA